jgi:hypothetical protein
VVTRRRLLAAGAVAVLAGCGEEEGPAPASEVLLRSLAAERALAAATTGGGRMRARVAERARERAQRIASALSAEGGRPHDVPAGGGGGDPVELGRAAVAAHIAALPSLAGPERRRLGADLVAGAAADVAVLGEHGLDAFPGSSR